MVWHPGGIFFAFGAGQLSGDAKKKTMLALLIVAALLVLRFYKAGHNRTTETVDSVKTGDLVLLGEFSQPPASTLRWCEHAIGRIATGSTWTGAGVAYVTEDGSQHVYVPSEGLRPLRALALERRVAVRALPPMKRDYVRQMMASVWRMGRASYIDTAVAFLQRETGRQMPPRPPANGFTDAEAVAYLMRSAGTIKNDSVHGITAGHLAANDGAVIWAGQKPPGLALVTPRFFEPEQPPEQPLEVAPRSVWDEDVQ